MKNENAKIDSPLPKLFIPYVTTKSLGDETYSISLCRWSQEYRTFIDLPRSKEVLVIGTGENRCAAYSTYVGNWVSPTCPPGGFAELADAIADAKTNLLQNAPDGTPDPVGIVRVGYDPEPGRGFGRFVSRLVAGRDDPDDPDADDPDA